MKSMIVAALVLPLTSAAFAQTTDLSQYTEIEDVNVVSMNGDRVGEVETVLVDRSGMPAALVVELEYGFLDLGDREVVVPIDALTWDNGRYTTNMSAEEMENLPVWDD